MVDLQLKAECSLHLPALSIRVTGKAVVPNILLSLCHFSKSTA